MADTKDLIATAKGMGDEIERQGKVLEGLLRKIENCLSAIHTARTTELPQDPKAAAELGAAYKRSIAGHGALIQTYKRQLARERRLLVELLRAAAKANQPHRPAGKTFHPRMGHVTGKSARRQSIKAHRVFLDARRKAR